MASPQTEDGYTKIANELLEAIIAYPFSKRQQKVLLYAIRKTYGFHKKWDYLSLSQIAEATGLYRPHAREALQELEAIGALFVDRSGETKAVSVNKDYTSWGEGTGTKTVPGTKTDRGPKQSQRGDQIGSQHGTKTVPTKDTAKDRKDRTGASSGSRHVYPDEFEQAWASYPKREGSNPKREAHKAWNARRREGVTAEQLLNGVQRYAAWVQARGKQGTETVMQAKRFFGPNEEWAQHWGASHDSGKPDWMQEVE